MKNTQNTKLLIIFNDQNKWYILSYLILSFPDIYYEIILMKNHKIEIKSWLIILIAMMIRVSPICLLGISQCCYQKIPWIWEGGYKAGSDCCASNFPHCGSCPNVNVCSSCQSQDYCLNLGVCETCEAHISNCLKCSNCNNCVICKSNNYTVNATSQCQLCSTLMLNCETCSSATVCTTCSSDLYAVSNMTFKCQFCNVTLNFCQRCSAIDQCTQCISHQNISLSHVGKCEYCGDLIPNCISCSSADTCTLCQQHYITINHGIDADCQLCANMMQGCSKCISQNICTNCTIGFIVQNGCSATPGCISVLKSNTNAVCTKCNPSLFYPTPSSLGVCTCLKGHLAGIYCTQMPGCTSIIKNTDSEICKACSSNENFYLLNGRCLCKKNYRLVNDKCVDICGDGIVITLPCDDGNNINGDGCSSQCQVESGYRCFVQSNKNSSSCVYQGGPVQLQLVCVYKQQQLNTAKVIFRLNPTINNFFKSKNEDSIRYISQSNSTIDHIEFSSPYISIIVKYSQSIEGKYGQISLEYDKKYIKSPKSTLSFKFTECHSDYLIYLPETQSHWKYQITLIIKILTLLVLIIWLLGSFSHKMIGIQTLHVFQIIIISQSFTQFYQPIVAYFRDIQNVLGLYKDLVLSSYSVVNRKQYMRLSYSADFISNMAVIIGFNFFVLLVYFSLYLINEYFKENGKYAITLQKINNFRMKMYDYFLFPIYIGFSFNFLVSLAIYCHRNYVKMYSYYLESFIALFSVASTCYVYFDQLKYVFISQANPKRPLNCKKSYVPIYLSYTCFMCLMIEFTLSKFLPYNVQIFACSQVLYSLFLLFYRPYMSALHNIGLLINQIGILSNLMWLLAQKYYPQLRPKQQLFATILVSQLCLMVIFSFIRIIYELRQPKINNKRNVISKKSPLKESLLQKQGQVQNEEYFSRPEEIILERHKHTIQFLNRDHFLNYSFEKPQKSIQVSQLRQFIRNLLVKQYINNQDMDHNERIYEYNWSLNESLIG